MDVNQLLADLSTDVGSIKEYFALLHKVDEYIKNKEKRYAKKLVYYFRGDKFCTPLQSGLFSSGGIAKEAENFKAWQAKCPLREAEEGKCDCSSNRGTYVCLAHMQHYNDMSLNENRNWRTRLLDFSLCPLVALRFACGKDNENCRKKVTVFVTEAPEKDVSSARIKMLMKMVACKTENEFKDLSANDGEGYLTKDTFVVIPSRTERVKRQQAITLFMGNITNGEILTDKAEPKSRNVKVTHQLSQNIGRGKKVRGYIATIGIRAESVADIREELDQCKYFNMDYLMGKDKKEEKA